MFSPDKPSAAWRWGTAQRVEIVGVIHIALGRQQRHAVALKIDQCIGKRLRARPTHPGEGLMGAAWAKADQPVTTIQRWAENRIGAPQSAKASGDIRRPKPRNITANKQRAWIWRECPGHALPQISRLLGHTWRAGGRQAVPIRPRICWRNGQDGLPPAIPCNRPGGGGQHVSVKAQGAARTNAECQSAFHGTKPGRTGKNDHNGSAHPRKKPDQRRRV